MGTQYRRSEKSIAFAFTLILGSCRWIWAKSPEEEIQELKEMVKILENRISDLEQSLYGRTPAPESTSAPASTTATVEANSNPDDIDVVWRNGLHFIKEDPAFDIFVGGRVNLDFFTGDVDGGDFSDGTRFRRARLRLGGKLYDDFEFTMQYDFMGDGNAKWRNVFLGYHGLDWTSIFIGQFKEPFGLEQLTHSETIPFLERAPLNTMTMARETGMMFHNSIADDRMTWAVGTFLNSNDFSDAEEGDGERGEWDVTARLTGLPWYEEEGRRLWHIGLSFSHREWDGDLFQYRARGSYSRGSALIDTGEFNVDSLNVYGAESAVVLGPFSFQGEYIFSDVDATRFRDAEFDGYYLTAGYFLTGENRPYKGGHFDQVIPFRNFTKDGGWGAWELAFRYSFLDLDDTPDPGALGGELHDYTAALNWYLNPNLRVMFNYVHAEADGAQPDDLSADIFQSRFELSF